ncbi:hypothetical protein ACHHYP_14163 [Achlya hypogyna]|uniref:Uncharacterized protein n=1 Tax=Achlya hypogyna TaxID=1202772 RepID=A0A1V9YDU3_ACHHY|nr:hypothetical protein ACHHYP_14163 [Achlya hypogyna]
MSMSYSELGGATLDARAGLSAPRVGPSTVKASTKLAFLPHSALSVGKESQGKSAAVVSPADLPPKAAVLKTTSYVLTESQQELTEIQQSVERLKKQRLQVRRSVSFPGTTRVQVEHIRHENERLEIELLRERGDNRALRQELERLKAAETDLEKQSAKLASLEAKYDRLEVAYREKRGALADAHEKRGALEKRWSQATESLQRMVDETTTTYEAKVAALEDDLLDREAKIHQQQEAMDEMRCLHESAQMKLEKKIERLEMANVDLEKKYVAQILIATLTATTTRQTAMIQECDRVICESEGRMNELMKRKSVQSKTQADLESRNQALEQKLQMLELEAKHDAEARSHTNEVRPSGPLSSNPTQELNKQLDEKAAQVRALEAAIAEAEHQATATQREMVVRERHRFHLDESNKELRKREKSFQGTIAGLEANLREVVDDRKGLIEKISALQDQLEAERQDRARWASTRLRLLAQFCDEENKLSESLGSRHGSHHGTILSDLSD